MIDFIPPQKIFLQSSKRGGMGVFCKEKIIKKEIIEICYLHDLKISMQEGNTNQLHWDYRFLFPRYEPTTYVIPWGYGCIYNHSDTPNIIKKADFTNNILEVYAIRDIDAGEELRNTYYSKKWRKCFQTF